MLKLRALADGQLVGVKRLELGAGKLLRLSTGVVQALAGGDGTLEVWSDEDANVELGEGWRLLGVEVREGRFYRIVFPTDGGQAILKLAGPHDWQNPVQPLDVNRDGMIAPLDVLLIINELLDPQFLDASRRLVDARSRSPFPLVFYDVNGDGFATAIDVLMGINYLNQSAVNAESEASHVAPAFLPPEPLLPRGTSPDALCCVGPIHRERSGLMLGGPMIASPARPSADSDIARTSARVPAADGARQDELDAVVGRGAKELAELKPPDQPNMFVDHRQQLFQDEVVDELCGKLTGKNTRTKNTTGARKVPR